MARARTGTAEDRWRGRPRLAALVRATAFLVPVGLSAAFALGAGALLPPADSTATRIGLWALVAAASTGVLMLTDRAARRLLPLAALLNLSIVFPDQAPSRYRVARRAAGVRSLQARLERARQLGIEREPVAAAALILELVSALQDHDRRTRGHSERVHLFTEMIARELGLPEADRDRLRWAALVHDVGKLAVPADVLNKASTPDADDWVLLRQHPFEGGRLCASLQPWMGPWWRTIEEHHEHFDGNGYPRGLAGKDISLGARIVSVADAFEVMTAARSYKRPLSAAAGREELARCAGTQFDPDIVRAFLNISLGRLRAVLGPLAWLVQYPVLERAIRAEGLLRLVSGLTAAATTAVLVGASTPADDAPSPAAAVAPVAAPAETADAPPIDSVEPRSAVRLPPVYVPEDGSFVPPPIDETPSAAPAVPVAPGPSAPPVAWADAATVAEDGVVTIDVLANDRDADDDRLTIAAIGRADLGAAATNRDGTVTYTPGADVTGVDAFEYTITDGTHRVTETVTVLIVPVPDAPIASDDHYVVAVDAPLVVPVPGVLANDRDADGDGLTATVETPPSAGTLVLDADGSFVYDGNGTVGTVSFSYVVTDDTGRSDRATVTIDVEATVSRHVFWLTGSGDDADTFALATSPPAPRRPEPDHDADGDPGIGFSASDGDVTATNPAAYQHWTHTFDAATSYAGQVKLHLWSSVAAFEGDADGHYHVWLHDCASDGSDCTQVLATDQRVEAWNAGKSDWVFRSVALGSIDHTFDAGRTLRLRLMFRDSPMWVAASGTRSTRIVVTGS